MIVNVIMNDAGRMHQFDRCGHRRRRLDIATTTGAVGQHQQTWTHTLAAGLKDMAGCVAQYDYVTVDYLKHSVLDRFHRQLNIH
jgi:hypothetical protein